MIYKNYIQFDQDYGGGGGGGGSYGGNGGGGSSTSISQFTGPAVTTNNIDQSYDTEIPTS